MDIKFFDDGKHSGSGLGSSDNGPVPLPAPTGQAAYDAATQGGTPIESDTKLDGLADAGFDPNGATSETGGARHPCASNPDSLAQPHRRPKYPPRSNYP